MRLLLWFYNRFQTPDLSKLTPADFRRLSEEFGDKGKRLLYGPVIALRNTIDEIVKGSQANIPIRIYQPNKKKNLPVIVYFHGGGFVINSIDTHDKVCRRLSRDNEAIVVSVDYRLAPEHRFPAAPTDCYDATVWVANNCDLFGGDPNRLIVMGDSAGGNLATVVAMKSRDESGPKIAYQVLVYPCTDARLCHPSIDYNAKGYILTREIMDWFIGHYKDSEEQILNPYMSPYLAPDLSNMPPALIQVAEYDPLFSEGKAYAEKLKAAGNRVLLTEYKGLIHTFFTMPYFSKRCLAAYEEIQQVLLQEWTFHKNGLVW